MKTPTLSIESGHGSTFSKFISELSEKFQPLQIFCFYKSSSHEKRLSCFGSEHSRTRYEYGLLIVTALATRIDYEVQDYANTHFLDGTITVICHSNQSIWEAIENNSRFFKNVYSKGELLYSHDGLLVKPSVQPFNPMSAGKKAERHYKHRIPLAEGFILCASECLRKEHYGICAFMLHQAVEQTCICLIRVHVAYRSEFHNLRRLLSLCNCFSEMPYKLFLSTTKDERLFELMSKSYSSARYKDGFSVSEQDIGELYKLTLSFFELAKTMCEKKIHFLESQAMQYQVRAQASQLSHETIIMGE